MKTNPLKFEKTVKLGVNVKRVLLWACLILASPLVHAETLTVAVAANVKYAFDDLAAEFKKETGVEAKGVFGSSGKITAQIKNGAPFDVFISADMEFPQALYQDKLATTAPRIYANGVLVLWTLNPLDLGKGMQVLVDPAVQKIAVANPKLAPYGREAIRALEYFKLRASVEQKLIYGESIAQVNQYIDAKAVEIGFTAKSVVLAPEVNGKGKWIEVPKESYEPIAQSVVILKHGSETHAESAKKFLDFLFSHKGRTIFEKYGYVLP